MIQIEGGVFNLGGIREVGDNRDKQKPPDKNEFIAAFFGEKIPTGVHKCGYKNDG
jgi:hypothetical protein